MKAEPKLVRVVAPHFVAGMEVANGRVTTTAPILAWARGKSVDEVRAYFKRKGWRASIINPLTHVDEL